VAWTIGEQRAMDRLPMHRPQVLAATPHRRGARGAAVDLRTQASLTEALADLDLPGLRSYVLAGLVRDGRRPTLFRVTLAIPNIGEIPVLGPAWSGQP
jgi:hypothetical protein